MKLKENCLPCILSQVIKVSNMVGLENKNELLKKTFLYLSNVDYHTISSPELIGEIFALLKEITGCSDPYKETREYYNHLFLERLPFFRDMIHQSENSFLKAISLSIIANIIDFNPIHELSLNMILLLMEEYQNKPLTIDDSGLLFDDLKEKKTLLYLGDNCGEICFDLLLLEQIKEINPNLEIYFATRERML